MQDLKAAKANRATIGATYGDQHPEYLKAAAQLKEARDALEESRQNVFSRIGVDYRQTLVRERMLSNAVAQTKQEVDDLTAQSFEYPELKHEADTAERVDEDLLAKIKQSGINSELQNNVIRLADSARPAAKPVFPDWPVIAACSMSFFSLANAVHSISAELTDATAKEAEPVEEALGVPGWCVAASDGDAVAAGNGPDGVRFAGNRLRSIQCGFFDEGIRHLRGYLLLSRQRIHHAAF